MFLFTITGGWGRIGSGKSGYGSEDRIRKKILRTRFTDSGTQFLFLPLPVKNKRAFLPVAFDSFLQFLSCLCCCCFPFSFTSSVIFRATISYFSLPFDAGVYCASPHLRKNISQHKGGGGYEKGGKYHHCCASGSGQIRNYLQVRIRIRNEFRIRIQI